MIERKESETKDESREDSGRNFGAWLRTSVSMKVVMIVILALMLLIPTVMVTDIIRERRSMHERVNEEISREWAGEQRIEGPILTLSREGQMEQHVLPETLKIEGEIVPESLHRGIYEVIVYSSDLVITGTFRPDQFLTPEEIEEVDWKDLYLSVGISDMRGVEQKVEVEWNEEAVEVRPGTKIPIIMPSGVTVELADSTALAGEEIPFRIRLHLQGSRRISFLPLGRTTDVRLASSWSGPSFTGAFLPDSREVGDSGFVASWTILEENRNFANSWRGIERVNGLGETSFGVTMMTGVDDYQKSMRSVKYAILIIAFTFLVFFLVEITNRRQIHPLQYALVGLALVLFYLLLVALSEHLGFDIAYIIAAGAITTMIGLYSLPTFRSKKLSLLLVGILGLTYSFLYVILQLEEYALLIGSFVLALVLGAVMYFTRNIDWYGVRRDGEALSDG